MAKQNVGFGERHLEKIVVGVAGAVLAAMAFLYVVQDPYTIEVSGEALGPNAYYPKVDEQASRVLGSLKSAQPKDLPQDKQWKPPVTNAQRNATDLPVVFAQLSPPIPKLDGQMDLGGALELVGILPPGKPAATSGRAYVAVPSGDIKLIGESAGNQPAKTEGAANPEDCHWVAVFASVPRRAQKEAFIKAKYAPGPPIDRQLLIVTNVEAERQRMLPNGEWGQPEKVARPFAPLVLSGRHTLDLQQQNGVQVIDPEEYKVIEDFKKEAVGAQPTILRPPFQNILPNEAKLDWAVPAAMPDGSKFEWMTDYGVTTPDSGETGAKPAGEGTAAPRLDYRKARVEIDNLIKQEKYIEADRKVREVLNNSTVPQTPKKDFEALATQLEPKVQQEMQQQQAMKTRRAEIESATLGADVDLLWVTDMSAAPGEIYRYRVRVLALNPHAGLIKKLKNAEDAAKVVLAGAWSEWSDPVSLKPEKYLFCTGIDQDAVKIELNQWHAGQWDKTSQTLSLGQPMAFQDKLKDFAYDAVAAAITPSRTYEERAVDKRGRIRYQEPRETVAIAFVRGDGQVEEHLVMEDVGIKRSLQDELSPKKETSGRALSPQPGADGGRRQPASPRTAGGRREPG